ncbi:methylated-DNA--[protein]-cysteine S-methyltransferase [Tetragenococcus muriaticus]|uniref:Methylated-DNA--protein-cysteine methyltransferase n=2 Tax=Tetragenococcus muriaticus TaxID=64642 RepID=A0A091CD70_9ENTE|nr:methylated-DNA--[protein]-cysteine S-methyltransferase [Tetragenococcus muriaticus]KFN91568.1 methylated-DNA-[protein]-cysteine methyltransferase [Tetragenococcus muriaticus 3MR10-3]KFN92100.1 methylated-DNA-[protein]-cysteine methyltransferase [Tetragenococcus muriaticus PMC-11-5]GMA46644.1 6-O-methylguanine DNA methyltransferase [Tetragenococcus muriaticus]
MLYKSIYLSPLGKLLILTDDQTLLGVWYEDQKYYGASYRLSEAVYQENSIIEEVTNWLDRYFNKENPDISYLPLAPDVTDFRKKVLEILKSTPYGQTITYQQITNRLKEIYGENVGSARAVGGAVGHNPISIIIPCHRVIGSDGSLTGYAGGKERKVALLTLEGVYK